MDIVNPVDSHYKTIRKRSARAVTDSRWVAAIRLASPALYPETFDYYGLQSAAARMNRDAAKHRRSAGTPLCLEAEASTGLPSERTTS